MKRFSFAALLFLTLAAIPAPAQDYPRTQPKVPPTAPPAQLPGEALPAGSDNRKPFVDSLRAVVFVDSEDKVATPPPDAAGLVVNGIPLLSRPGLDAVVRPYLGQPLSLEQLGALVKEVILWCRAQDRPVVDVAVPQQDVTGGVLQLVFVEGRVGKVQVEGNRWFSTSSLRDSVRLRPGDEIGAERLVADVDWINRNPFEQANVVFAPGQEMGRTDVVLQARDRFPLRPYVAYENSGNAITGEDRYEAGFNWGDAFLLGHQLNYQFTTSGDLRGLVAHSGSYVVPLPWRHTLTFFGAISSSEAETGPSSLSGSGSQLGLRYDIPLPGVDGVYSHDVQLGYDWKQSDNSLEFGAIPATASLTDTGQFVLGYAARITDAWGATTVNPQVFWSPGSWWQNQDLAAYGGTRTGASPDYAYVRLDVVRTTRLPEGFSLTDEFLFQASDGNLLPSEQFQMGGSQSVRGYQEWDLSGTDEGWILRNEVRTPGLSPAKWLDLHAVDDQLQFLGFLDYGSARSYSGQITLNNGRAVDAAVMASAGPGLRYTVGPYFSLRADYGFQLHDTGDPHAGRWSLGATLSY